VFVWIRLLMKVIKLTKWKILIGLRVISARSEDWGSLLVSYMVLSRFVGTSNESSKQ